ncbi:hypothetical protein DFJ73DRAFT_829879 [Zopfochytrium polystomum]|nr:hypothetical protein DFJ73DRAFT_829879 [Zopfochytrium polystomum]
MLLLMRTLRAGIEARGLRVERVGPRCIGLAGALWVRTVVAWIVGVAVRCVGRVTGTTVPARRCLLRRHRRLWHRDRLHCLLESWISNAFSVGRKGDRGG